MQTPHRRPGCPCWCYYPYAGKVRGSAKSLGVPVAESVERAVEEMLKRGDHVPDKAAAPAPPRGKTLLQHLDEYEAYKRAKNAGSGRTYSAARVRQVIRACKFADVSDVTEDRVVRYVASLRGPRPKIGTKTANDYLTETRRFFKWMVRNRRCTENPLAAMELFRSDGDVRFARRDFTKEEQEAIFSAAKGSRVRFRGLGGADRYLLYRTASLTGLRAGAIGHLTPAHFNLDADPPTVTVPARNQKNRERHSMPLNSSLAVELREYLKGRGADKPVWPGGWVDNAAMMLRVDLEAAGVPEVTPEGHAHFHSFRHTFTTKVARVATNVKAGMSLTGHKTASMFNHYTHTAMDERVAIVEQLDAVQTKQGAGSPLDWSSLLDEFRRTRMDGQTVIIGDIGREHNGEWVLFGEPHVFGKIHQLNEGTAVLFNQELNQEPCETSSAQGADSAGGASTSANADGFSTHTSNIHKPCLPQKLEPMKVRLSIAGVIEDKRFSRVLNSWNSLPEHVRLSILTLVDSAKTDLAR